MLIREYTARDLTEMIKIWKDQVEWNFLRHKVTAGLQKIMA